MDEGVRAWLVAGIRPTAMRLREHDLMLLSAGLTFYALIAVVPLLLVALFVASLVLGEATLVALANDLAAVAPQQLGFGAQLATLAEAGADLHPLVLMAALLPATTYGEGVLRAFSRLGEQPAKRAGIRGRIRALAILGTLPLLVLVSLGAVAALPRLLGPGAASSLLAVYLTFVLAWGAGSLLVGVTFRAFSAVPLTRRALVWSAAGTGSMLAGTSLGWVAVLELGLDVGAVYGGAEELGIVVMLAVYLFLIQIECLAGYAYALSLSERR
jgi:membrane protein